MTKDVYKIKMKQYVCYRVSDCHKKNQRKDSIYQVSLL